MLRAGQVFRLKTDIVAIEAIEGAVHVLVVPPGSTVRVVRFPCSNDDRMADALWDDKPIEVFGLDLCHRAEQLQSMSAGASRG